MTFVVIMTCHNYTNLYAIKITSIGDEHLVHHHRHHRHHHHHMIESPHQATALLCAIVTAYFLITVVSPHIHLLTFNLSTAEANASSVANTVTDKYHVAVTVTKRVSQSSSL